MRRAIKSFIFASLFIFGVAAPAAVIATPTSVSAAKNCEARVLGIPPWYRGLTNNDKDCSLKTISDDGKNGEGLSNFIWKIVLNIIEMAIVITAYIAVFFILYGGFLFMTGGGNPSMIEKARKTITNAAVGLIISMAAIGITNFIFSIIS